MPLPYCKNVIFERPTNNVCHHLHRGDGADYKILGNYESMTDDAIAAMKAMTTADQAGYPQPRNEKSNLFKKLISAIYPLLFLFWQH